MNTYKAQHVYRTFCKNDGKFVSGNIPVRDNKTKSMRDTCWQHVSLKREYRHADFVNEGGEACRIDSLLQVWMTPYNLENDIGRDASLHLESSPDGFSVGFLIRGKWVYIGVSAVWLF